MKKLLFLLMILALALPAAAQPPTARDILKKIDQNLVVEQAFTITTMKVHGRAGTRTITSQSWVKGDDQALVEYLSPPREKGKKMLKLGDKLWTYTPEPNDRIITIAGHLLRQSVMGSDLSYEDITENSSLAETYEAMLTGQEEMRDRKCVVVALTAKNPDEAYYSRKIWVDMERWLPIREERFARSGRLLKTFDIIEVFQIKGRWYPKKMIFKDALSLGEGTEYIIDSIDFEVDIPDHLFTKASLRR